MKAKLHRLAVTLALLTFGTAAQAVPIHFDFTGTVFYEEGPGAAGLMNQRVSGGFSFETEGLTVQRSAGDVIESHSDVGATRSSSHLTIGDLDFALPAFRDRLNGVHFFDGCSPAPTACAPGAGESFMLFAYSGDLPDDTTSVTGTFSVAQLLFSSSVPFVTNPTDPAGRRVPAFDYIDVLAGIESTSIIDLPLLDLSAAYNKFVFNCVDGVCNADVIAIVGFRIDSVDRGFDNVSVPEPGTLGLLGAALAGMGLFQRRLDRRQLRR